MVTIYGYRANGANFKNDHIRPLTKKKGNDNMRKMMNCVMALVMVASMTGCGKETKVPTEPVGENTQIPNPFAECETIEEAEKLAGFDLVIPEKVPEGFSDKNISAIQDEMIDITYDNGEDKLCIRKGKGTDDISGDYTQYDEISTVEVNNRSVTLKGSGDKINVAVWQDGDYTYSIVVNSGEAGIDSNVIIDMVKGIE